MFNGNVVLNTGGSNKNALPGWAIAVIVSVIVVIGLVLVILKILWWYTCCKSKEEKKDTTQPLNTEDGD